MTAPLLALSLSNTLLKVGALAAFAALLGIAVLSLLVFSQARELKRLREWAGRAPERAAELEQRVSAEAAARAQRAVQPRAGGVVGTPVPRTTPVVARGAAPVTGQSQAVAVAGAAAPVASSGVAASAGTPPDATATADPSAQSSPAQSPGAASTADPPAPAPTTAPAAPVPGQPAFVPTGQSAPVAAAGNVGEIAPELASDDKQVDKGEGSSGAQPEVGLAAATAASAATRVAQGASALSEREQPAKTPAAPTPTPTPATAAAAARAGVPSGRSPLPPPPASGRSAQAPQEARPAPSVRPGVASAGIRGVPDAPGAATQRTRGGRGRGVDGPPFLREERSAGRTTALIVGGVVLGVAVLVGVLLSIGGGGSSPGKTTGGAASHTASTGARARGSHHHHAQAAVASPTETRVVVLNGTETNGLAHRISANLQQSGYAQSAALEAHPPGRSTSVVEYASGHSAEARQVGQTLGIAQVQPLESAVTPLVGDATVVVIAGADQAALGGEASGASSETSGASSEAAQ
jgi:hypothetical protein